MIKTFRILFSSLAVLVILLSCSLPVLASDIEVPMEEFITPLIDADITITSQPSDISAYAGDTATLSVIATGDIASYRWYYRTTETGTWKYASGTGYNTNIFTFSVAEGMNGYQYVCQIADGSGIKLLTNVVTLTVLDPPETEPPATDPPVSDTASVTGYLDWFLTFVQQGIAWMGAQYIVGGVSLLHFIIAVGVICIVVGGILIR